MFAFVCDFHSEMVRKKADLAVESSEVVFLDVQRVYPQEHVLKCVIDDSVRFFH